MKYRFFGFSVFFLFCVLSFPLVTSAKCSYERTAELAKLAGNVQFNYSYNEQKEFTVYITNMTDDFYITDDYGNDFDGTGDKTVSYSSGSSISYIFYSKDSNCPNELIIRKYLNIPVYNHYYDSTDCKTYPDFKYCKMWMNSDVNFNDFSRELKKYISDNYGVKETENKKTALLGPIVNFVLNNIVYFALGFGLIVLFIILRIIIRRKRRL